MAFCIEARERGWLWIGSSSTDGFLPRLQARQLEAVFRSAPHIKAQAEKRVDDVTESWRFPLSKYDELWELLCKNHIECSPRSSLVDAFYGAFPASSALPSDFTPKYMEHVKLKNGQKILPFQLEGMKFGISHCGRCLIGDEPGCGKTLQAIGIAYEFRDDWPVLVIVPSSLRSVWKLQLELWGENIFRRDEIQIVYEGRVPILSSVKIVVTSYELANLNSDKFLSHRFKFLICDEAHKIKNGQAQRTQTVMDLARQANRILLMTGTPIVNIATDVYQLLKVLAGNNQSFPSQACFEERYFLKREKAFKGKLQCSDPCREHELHAVLTSTIMVRRLKRDVLSQMPDKFRSPIDLDLALVQELKEFRDVTIQGEYDSLKQNELQRLFYTTCCIKKEASATYVAEVIDCTIHDKYLVFAHHVEMLDTLEKALAKSLSIQGGSLIRICGKTPMRQRGELVDKFQMDPKCRVAILSITACAEGITLTAASNIIFAELHWTPAIMNQCEGRAHRMGQKSNVHIQYLLTPGKNSIDHKAYNALTEKQLHCDRAIDGLQKTRDEDAFPRFMKEKPKVLNNLEMSKKHKLFPKRLCRPSPYPSPTAESTLSSSSTASTGQSTLSSVNNDKQDPPMADSSARQPNAPNGRTFKPNLLAGRRIIEKPIHARLCVPETEPKATASAVGSFPKTGGYTLRRIGDVIPGSKATPKSASSPLPKPSPPKASPKASLSVRPNSSSSTDHPREPDVNRARRVMTAGEKYLHEMKQAILRKIDVGQANPPKMPDGNPPGRIHPAPKGPNETAPKDKAGPVATELTPKDKAGPVATELTAIDQAGLVRTELTPIDQIASVATELTPIDQIASVPTELTPIDQTASAPTELAPIDKEPVPNRRPAREPIDLLSDDDEPLLPARSRSTAAWPKLTQPSQSNGVDLDPPSNSGMVVQGAGGPVYSVSAKRACSPRRNPPAKRRMALGSSRISEKELPEAGFNKGKQSNRTMLRNLPGANAKNARGMYGLFVDEQRANANKLDNTGTSSVK